ncbi:hypothetical protein SAMN07250955_103275 [Arboricoccus pini]|uniref:Uncharacterized protein n=1 Tax=Arboricoccus pini TaxID=1963835 RepID=A0A212QUD8_9PROT|nr:hypothetical protein [Arboricoccus pini]SNB63158.1 hypothetical protein SAMN07250955_103275 [Arboricoccus pini]
MGAARSSGQVMTHLKFDRLGWTWLPVALLAVFFSAGAAMAEAPRSLSRPPPKPSRLYLQADPGLFGAEAANRDAVPDAETSTDVASGEDQQSTDAPSALSTRIVVADRKDDPDWALKSPYEYNSSRVTNLMDNVGLDEFRIEMKTRF